MRVASSATWRTKDCPPGVEGSGKAAGGVPGSALASAKLFAGGVLSLSASAPLLGMPPPEGMAGLLADISLRVSSFSSASCNKH